VFQVGGELQTLDALAQLETPGRLLLRHAGRLVERTQRRARPPRRHLVAAAYGNDVERFAIVQPVERARRRPARAAPGGLSAPMPGTVMSFKVIQGQAVKQGDVILILEAMKMENEIVAPVAGTIASIRVPQGAAVNTGDALIDLA